MSGISQSQIRQCRNCKVCYRDKEPRGIGTLVTSHCVCGKNMVFDVIKVTPDMIFQKIEGVEICVRKDS